MALNENERMTTRQRRPNYLLLNNGYDDKSLPEDQISESFQAELDTFTNITTSSNIMPSESVSQTIASAMPTETRFHYSQKQPRSAPVTGWVWDYVTSYARSLDSSIARIATSRSTRNQLPIESLVRDKPCTGQFSYDCC